MARSMLFLKCFAVYLSIWGLKDLITKILGIVTGWRITDITQNKNKIYEVFVSASFSADDIFY